MADDNNLNEEQIEPERRYSFLKETFKDEQMTGRRIVRVILQIVGKGLIFGLAACIAFCVLKPWVEAYFPEDTPEMIIPKDDEEVGEAEAEEEKEAVTLTVENYREINTALNEVAQEARKGVVEVRVKNQEADWTEENAEIIVSGIVVWDNGTEFLILAPYGDLPEGKNVAVQFSSGKECKAHYKYQDSNLQFRIYGVWKSEFSSAELAKVKVVEWGNSNVVQKGDPVISIGMQFGYGDGMGYGVVSSKEHKITLPDYQYQILTTDIAMANGGSCALFNIDGELIGLADSRTASVVDADVVSGYAISKIKRSIELLSNGKGIPYIGVVGVEVTEEISQEEGIPMGVYVKEVEADSPAMQAGIQVGDIVVTMKNMEVMTMAGYSNVLIGTSQEEVIPIRVKRLGAQEYEEVEFNVTVGVKQ